MLCEDAEEDVPTVVSKMMKARRDGAVVVLCHRYVDRRVMDEGGLRHMVLDGWSSSRFTRLMPGAATGLIPRPPTSWCLLKPSG